MVKPLTETRRALDRAFNEVKRNPPERVRVVEEKHGQEAADRMRIAIALGKARQYGARIPKGR